MIKPDIRTEPSSWEAPNSICPCHADEVRDDRFIVLDKLVGAAWGSVPMYVIEREIEKHGYSVLSKEPYIYRSVQSVSYSDLRAFHMAIRTKRSLSTLQKPDTRWNVLSITFLLSLVGASFLLARDFHVLLRALLSSH